MISLSLKTSRVTFALALCVLCARLCGADAQDQALQFFESKIRPLLAEQCYSCHSSKAKKLKGGLSLDSRKRILKGGENGSAVVPGEPGKSRLIEAVSYRNADLQMPPDSKLGDGEIADLTRWVQGGAAWPDEPEPVPSAAVASAAADVGIDIGKRKAEHWAWAPVKAQKPPLVANSGWVRDPIDAFVLARLEENKLIPAAEADRRTWIRRATFDLTGLPPTPEQVRDFVGDATPQAFEKVVDRLLAAPQFGERWGRHWLDLVRYGESCGHEYDFTIPQAYEYRDYVIRALNADVPYDRLVTEHIAGDLAGPRVNPQEGFDEAVLGTGFFMLGESVHSPVDVRQNQADRFDNMIDVTTKAFLGLTVSCARCHDHKFDAIGTADYYALYGYLKSSRATQVAMNEPAIEAKARELEKLKAGIGRLAVDAAKVRAEKLPEALLKFTPDPKLAATHPLYPWLRLSRVPAERFIPECRRLLAEVEKRAAAEARSQAIEIPLKNARLEEAAFRRDARFVVGTEKRPFELRAEGTLSSDALSRRLEGTARSESFEIQRPFLHVLAKGDAGRISVVIDNLTLIRNPLQGGLRRTVDSPVEQDLVFDLRMWPGHRAYLEFNDTLEGVAAEEGHPSKADAYLAVSRAVQDENGGALAPKGAYAVLRADAADAALPRSAQELAERYKQMAVAALERAVSGSSPGLDEASANLLNALMDAKLLEVPVTPQLQAALAEFRAVEAQIPRVRRAQAMVDGNGEDEHIFIRGSHKTPGALVPRRFLAALDGMTQPVVERSGSGRLTLARQLTSRNNPLFTRVIVNRLWQHLFGRGIVSSVDNFGKLGEKPTHPELLDFLAERFVNDGWSIKTALRKMLLSSAYRMDSRPSPANDPNRDPGNALLAQQRPKRLEGEAIRDSMLAISTRLNPAMYGPSVEVHVTPFMNGRGMPNSGPLDGDGRRSIYISVRRNFLPPFMLAFDTPVPFSTMGRRTVSNVPSQALILLNDPFVIVQAERWSKRVLSSVKGDGAARIGAMYEAAFAREPSELETKEGLGFVEELQKAPGGNEADAWKNYAHALMNTKEFVFVR